MKKYIKTKQQKFELNLHDSYFVTHFILSRIEEKFGEIYNNNFVIDLTLAVSRYIFYNTATGSINELQKELYPEIENAESFETIPFTPFQSTTTYFKGRLEDKEYTKKLKKK